MFDLKSIPKEIHNADELKKVFKKLHVVDADTKMNNITGEQLGEGKIKVRVHDHMKKELNRAIEGLKQKGCQIEKMKASNIGRKR